MRFHRSALPIGWALPKLLCSLILPGRSEAAQLTLKKPVQLQNLQVVRPSIDERAVQFL